MSRISKWWLVIVAFVLIISLGFSNIALGKVKINWWFIWTGPSQERISKVTEMFNQSQNEIEVVYSGVSDFDTKLLASIAAGNPPEMISLWDDRIADYAERYALLALDDLAADAGINMDDFIPSLRRAGEYKDKTYGLPMTPWVVSLYINKGIFEEVGLVPEVPRTIAELDIASEKIVKIDASGKIERLAFVPWQFWFGTWWSKYFGGEIYDSVTHTWDYTSPEIIDTYKWMQEYAKKYGVTQLSSFVGGSGSYSSIGWSFFSGKAAIDHMGCWHWSWTQAYAPEIELAVGYPAVKDLADYGTIYSYSDTFAIPSTSKHPKEAMKFMAWFYKNVTAQSFYFNGNSTYSPMMSINDNPDFIDNSPNPFIRYLYNQSKNPKAFSALRTPINLFWADKHLAAQDAIVRLADLEKTLAKLEKELQKEEDRVLGR